MVISPYYQVVASSSKIYIAGELHLDSGQRIPVKRHYDYEFGSPGGRTPVRQDVFTVFAPSDAVAPAIGAVGTLLLLKTLGRSRVRVDTVDKLGTELRIVGHLER